MSEVIPVKVECADERGIQSKNNTPSVYPQSKTEFIVYPNIFPMPHELAKLVQPGLTNNENLARPSILENANTSQLMKLLKFKIWADNKVNTNAFGNLSDVIKAEVKIFEDHGFNKRNLFQVMVRVYVRAVSCMAKSIAKPASFYYRTVQP